MSNHRQKRLLDFGWRFHLGDVDIPRLHSHHECYLGAKAERGQGPAAAGYYDLDWDLVDLPHDYVVATQTPDEAESPPQGYLARPNAWYRRCFRVDEADRGQRFVLLFDGVATHATVWVNGHLMARNFCGYTSFWCDISEVLHVGDRLNVISVYVDCSEPEGWFYEGGGIYRHVWLLQSAALSVAPWGVFVHPERLPDGRWQVPVETTLYNAGFETGTVDVASCILDGEGVGVATATATLCIGPRASATIQSTLSVVQPMLWDLESPALYTLHTIVTHNGRVIDEMDTPFGFRTVRFDANEGFFLNDRHVKLNGTANHGDFGPLGNALPDRVQDFRIRRLKDMGCNAYRSAHNPPTPELLDACDRLGMLVMDENRWFETSEEAMRQVDSMVLRDRNHPSIILWSAGNEEPLQVEPRGARILAALRARIHALDPTRPVTLALNGGWLDHQASAVSDVIGMNYGIAFYDAVHAQHPGTPMLAPETCAADTNRGEYVRDEAAFIHDAYDLHWAPFGTNRRNSQRQIGERPFFCGQFIWTGIDYRGETQWPGLFSGAGALDPCCYPKDNFYLHQAQWTDKPMVHILPHWNWPGDEGQVKDVWVYSNCESVELRLHGQSLGEQRLEPYEHGRWAVSYEPGTLEAIGRIGGEIVVREKVRTTGAPVALGLRLEDGGVRADGEDVALVTCYALDAQGLPVPNADPVVTFQVSGPGRLRGTFGAITDYNPVGNSRRRMQQGLCMAVVQAGRKAGLLRVTATAPGMSACTLDIALKAAPPRPAVPALDYDFPVTRWRMTPTLQAARPDPAQADFYRDMNSWVAVSVGQGPQKPFALGEGWAVFGCMVRIPPFPLKRGQRLQLCFESVRGASEATVVSSDPNIRRPMARLARDIADAAPLQITLEGYEGGDAVAVTLAVKGDGPDCGILRPVHWSVIDA